MATATATPPDLEVGSATLDPQEHYEVVDNQVVEEPPLGALEAWIASRIVRGIVLFDPPGALGDAVEEMLFVLDRSPRLRRRPDVAFVSRDRWAANRPIPREAAWDVVPDLAVEIISPTDLVGDLMAKLEEYFRAGVRLVWVVHPDVRKIYAHESPISVRILQVGDELDGGLVLPGFLLPLASLFEPEEDGPTPVA